ncbi:MAG TPA: hypothetical protein DIS66_07215 [Candidatus Omnitrophica bacterium]|nr:hypothetical protein [Candidatus Omnitrophota bacterium]
MKKENKQKLVIAALTGLMAVAGSFSVQNAAHADDAQCYGVNKCKGAGDCGGKGTSCAGTNSCKGQGWVSMAKESCLRLEGGSLTPKS